MISSKLLLYIFSFLCVCVFVERYRDRQRYFFQWKSILLRQVAECVKLQKQLWWKKSQHKPIVSDTNSVTNISYSHPPFHSFFSFSLHQDQHHTPPPTNQLYTFSTNKNTETLEKEKEEGKSSPKGSLKLMVVSAIVQLRYWTLVKQGGHIVGLLSVLQSFPVWHRYANQETQQLYRQTLPSVGVRPQCYYVPPPRPKRALLAKVEEVTWTIPLHARTVQPRLAYRER